MTKERGPISPAMRSDYSNHTDSHGDIGADESDIRELFSFVIQRLASVSTKIATISIYEPYGLSIPEWRVLAVLGYLGEVSVLTVAKHSALLRTQLPRVTSSLEKRGLVLRKSNPEDGRSALLSLTPSGRKIVNEILDKSSDRNEAMLADLSALESKELLRMIRIVLDTSRLYLDEKQPG